MKKTFSYQPDFAATVICWSYTVMFFLLGTVIALEVLKFQLWSVACLIIFLILTFAQIRFRKANLTPTGIVLKTVLPINQKDLLFKNLEKVTLKGRNLRLKTDIKTYSIYLKKSAAKGLYDAIINAKPDIQAVAN